jgi:hypothetical protein
MLTTFCLRLACGMIGCLLLLKSNEVNPRFYRTHYLVALGLVGLAGAGSALSNPSSSELMITARPVFLSIALILCVSGSIIWSIEGNAGHRGIGVASLITLVVTLETQGAWTTEDGQSFPSMMAMVGNLTSAALLGSAVTAMLLGHFYLIAPGMSLAPLIRLLAALFVATGLRMTIAAWGFWSWSADHSLINWEDETVLWLPIRWGLGFGGPLILGWMARSAALIRSTQSATGILYVVVVLTILGELTSQLLTTETGFSL